MAKRKNFKRERPMRMIRIPADVADYLDDFAGLVHGNRTWAATFLLMHLQRKCPKPKQALDWVASDG